MVKFKYFNKEGIQKAGSIALVTTILTTGICTFSGCSKKDEDSNTGIDIVEEKRKDYALVIENDIAVIYEEVEYVHNGGSIRAYIKDGEDVILHLPAGETHIFDNVSLEEVEEYARMFLTENGKIEYYNVEEKGKTLTRTKDNS